MSYLFLTHAQVFDKTNGKFTYTTANKSWYVKKSELSSLNYIVQTNLSKYADKDFVKDDDIVVQASDVTISFGGSLRGIKSFQVMVMNGTKLYNFYTSSGAMLITIPYGYTVKWMAFPETGYTFKGSSSGSFTATTDTSVTVTAQSTTFTGTVATCPNCGGTMTLADCYNRYSDSNVYQYPHMMSGV